MAIESFRGFSSWRTDYYSEHLLIRTLKVQKNMFELANVLIIGQNLLASEVHRTKKFSQIEE